MGSWAFNPAGFDQVSRVVPAPIFGVKVEVIYGKE